MFCTKCGNPIPDNLTACPNCAVEPTEEGFQAFATEPAPNQFIPQEPQPDKAPGSKAKLIKMIGLGVVAAVAVGAIAMLVMSLLGGMKGYVYLDEDLALQYLGGDVEKVDTVRISKDVSSALLTTSGIAYYYVSESSGYTLYAVDTTDKEPKDTIREIEDKLGSISLTRGSLVTGSDEDLLFSSDGKLYYYSYKEDDLEVISKKYSSLMRDDTLQYYVIEGDSDDQTISKLTGDLELEELLDGVESITRMPASGYASTIYYMDDEAYCVYDLKTGTETVLWDDEDIYVMSMGSGYGIVGEYEEVITQYSEFVVNDLPYDASLSEPVEPDAFAYSDIEEEMIDRYDTSYYRYYDKDDFVTAAGYTLDESYYDVYAQYQTEYDAYQTNLRKLNYDEYLESQTWAFNVQPIYYNGQEVVSDAKWNSVSVNVPQVALYQKEGFDGTIDLSELVGDGYYVEDLWDYIYNGLYTSEYYIMVDGTTELKLSDVLFDGEEPIYSTYYVNAYYNGIVYVETSSIEYPDDGVRRFAIDASTGTAVEIDGFDEEEVYGSVIYDEVNGIVYYAVGNVLYTVADGEAEEVTDDAQIFYVYEDGTTIVYESDAVFVMDAGELQRVVRFDEESGAGGYVYYTDEGDLYYIDGKEYDDGDRKGGDLYLYGDDEEVLAEEVWTLILSNSASTSTYYYF